MTKNELIQQFAIEANIPKIQSEVIVNQFFETIFNALSRNEGVEIRGFGSFHIKSYKARQGRNPKSGDLINVPEKKLPCFRMGKELKQILNGKKNY